MACVSNGHILRTNGCLSIGFEVLDLLINLIGGVSVKSENNNRNHYQTADHLERARHLQL
jgi:anionic cell wall polymer biosynthesis LytR-Cps2A-Psr (LCP) family protein